MCQTVNSEVLQWTLAFHTYPVCLHVTCKPPDCCVTVDVTAQLSTVWDAWPAYTKHGAKFTHAHFSHLKLGYRWEGFFTQKKSSSEREANALFLFPLLTFVIITLIYVPWDSDLFPSGLSSVQWEILNTEFNVTKVMLNYRNELKKPSDLCSMSVSGIDLRLLFILLECNQLWQNNIRLIQIEVEMRLWPVGISLVWIFVLTSSVTSRYPWSKSKSKSLNLHSVWIQTSKDTQEQDLLLWYML